MSLISEIKLYNTDSGKRDLGSEKILPKNTSFGEVLNKAIDLHSPLIVLTSYISEDKPGQYYIKGHKTKKTYEELKNLLDTNLSEKKYSRVKSWLIKY